MTDKISYCLYKGRELKDPACGTCPALLQFEVAPEGKRCLNYNHNNGDHLGCVRQEAHRGHHVGLVMALTPEEESGPQKGIMLEGVRYSLVVWNANKRMVSG